MYKQAVQNKANVTQWLYKQAANKSLLVVPMVVLSYQTNCYAENCEISAAGIPLGKQQWADKEMEKV